eukprot:gb/GECG01009702.1/.p1 GENE.gb/GECG01009702.1/~~gb/GECG01009702.1/.p1  ORF type:complete len:144 (+),score=5.64 gb/GECG01009702.1/:1-432(+)
MSTIPPSRSEWRQEVGPRKPKEGFPSKDFRFRPYARGPPGYVFVFGVIGVTAFGLYRWSKQAREREYFRLAKLNERYERAYVLQAIEEKDWQKRHKAMIDREREWMSDKPDWVVNRSVYYTQRQDRPPNNPLDPRTMSKLNPY